MSKQCAKCGGKIGLTSYKIKDKQIVCGDCMKKAGYGMTTPYKIIRSLNLEDLDKDPSEKRKLNISDHTAHNNHDIGNDRMRTTEEMVEFCLKYGYGKGMTKKWTTHHFNLISDQLNSDEYVIFCFVGLHNYISSTKHDNNYAYALTNKRLIVAQQKMIGNNVQSIILDNLNNISKKRGMLLGTLTIDTLGKVLNVAVDKDTVDRISDSLNEIIYNLKRRNISATNSNTSTISSASEIRKYKELLDDGIITEEEFNKKKQELLDL